MIKNVIVLSAGPNGLGVIRSLHKEGIRTISVTRSSTDVSNFSRIPKMKYILKETSGDQQFEELKNILLCCPAGSIVLPTSDWFVSFLNNYVKELSDHLRFLLPKEDIVELLIDKALETRTVGEILPIPLTEQRLTTSESLKNKLGLPIIIKPRSHKHMVLGKKNIIINSEEQLNMFFEQFSTVLGHLIAQQIIPGPDSEQWVCNCVFDRNSELVQAFTFNRLSLSPSHYGVTSYARSEYNADVIAYTERLGKHLKYIGPAMVEFKRDPRDGVYKYIELNPRLGICNFFDTSCGINNPYATCRVIAGENLHMKPEMKNNVIFLSLYEDFFSKRRDGEKPGSIILNYLKNARLKHVFIYFVWWDPGPALRLAGIQLAALIRTLIRKSLHRK